MLHPCSKQVAISGFPLHSSAELEHARKLALFKSKTLNPNANINSK
jgi:hypothetical protein